MKSPALLLTLFTLCSSAAFADVKLPYNPHRCHAPGPDECWDRSGQGRYRWECDHCVTVENIDKAKNDCAQEIHKVALSLEDMKKPVSCPVAVTDNKYPDFKSAANGLDSVAGAYEAGTRSAADAEASSASLAQTANNPAARICAVAKAVDDQAADTEDKLVNADANLAFVPEFNRIQQAIGWQTGLGTNAPKPCYPPQVVTELKNKLSSISRRCIYSQAYAKKKASVRDSKKHISSLKKTLKDQCLREKSVGQGDPGGKLPDDPVESTITNAQ